VVDDAVAADVTLIGGNAATSSGTVNFTTGNTLASGTSSHMLNVSGGVAQADMVKLNSNSTAAAYLGYFVLGTGHSNGVRLSAEQLKLSINDADENAFSIVNGIGTGMYIYGGYIGQYISGDYIGQYIFGDFRAAHYEASGTNNAFQIGIGVINTVWNTTTPPTTAQIRTELAPELALIDVATSTRATPAQILTNTANTLLTNTAGYVTTTGGSVTIDAQDVRNAMALAYTGTASAASGSVDATLNAIQAKTDTIATGGDVVTVRRTSGYIEIVQSTANLNATSTQFTFTKASTDTGWPSDLLSNGSYAVTLNLIPTNGGSVTTVSGGVDVSATSVRVDVSAATATALTAATSAGPNYKYQVWASTATTNAYCLDSGTCRVIDDIRS
jgi:hypothetical protein